MKIILSGVPVRLSAHAVHIDNNDRLWELLRSNPEQHTDAFIHELNTLFAQHFGRQLNIDPGSLAVEIWGHVYADHFAAIMDRLINLKLIDALVHPLQEYCAVIDCGEKGHDQNRWFWDLLGPLKPTIARLLPNKS